MVSPESSQARRNGPLYRDAEHVIAVHANAILVYSSNAPNPRFLEAWARTVDELVERGDTPLLVLTIIDRRAHAPDDASKQAIRDTVLRHAASIQAFAYVVEGEGFAAAAVRSALALISLLARYRFPQKVFGRVDEAVAWMLSRGVAGERPFPAAGELISAANALSAELSAAAAAG